MKLSVRALKFLQAHPERFISKVLGCETLRDYQVRVCQTVATNEKIAISSCHALGKTFIAARIGLSLLFAHPNSILITTAPTHRQVELLLWGEIHHAYTRAKYPLGGRLLNTKLDIVKGKWYAIGFSPEKQMESGLAQEGSTFQGFHSDYVFVIFDEATGIPRDIWVQVEGILTSGKKVKFICIGNPTSTNCEFFQCFSNPAWATIKLSCFDSPNLQANGFFTIEDIQAELRILSDMSRAEVRGRIAVYAKPIPYLITAQFVIEKAMPSSWGLDHPLFVTKVLGEFDESGAQTLIKTKHINQASKRRVHVEPVDSRYIGLDVARGGDDSIVWSEIVGQREERLKRKSVNTDDLMETVGDTINFLETGPDAHRRTVLCIDATGIGSGVYDRLRELKSEGKQLRNVEIIELHYGYSADAFEDDPEEKARLKKQYANLKAYMFDKLANDVKNSLALKDNPTRENELVDIRYKFNSRGQLAIESKDDYKARTGKGSPDDADALMMSNFARYITGGVGEWSGDETTFAPTSPDLALELELATIEDGGTIAGSLSAKEW